MEVGIVMGKTAALGALAAALTVLGAPAAGADPDTAPVDPPAPQALIEAQPAAQALLDTPAPQALLDTPAAQALLDTPAAVSVTPPDGVPHLTTPDNLPPGTTQTPTRGQSSTTEYLKDVWRAVRNQDVTMAEALVLIAQRPMDSSGVLQAMTPHSSPLAPAGTAPVPGPGSAEVTGEVVAGAVSEAAPISEAPAVTLLPEPQSAPAAASESPAS